MLRNFLRLGLLLLLWTTAFPGKLNAQVYSITTIAGSSYGNADGTNNTARFASPEGIVAQGNGDLYVADTANRKIRRIVLSGTNWVVTTIAGNGSSGIIDGTNTSARFSNPVGITTDPDGSLFVTDSYCIRKIVPLGQDWIVTTIAGSQFGDIDGTGMNARFKSPQGIISDGAGTLYIADAGTHTIRKAILIETNWMVTTIAGAGVSGTSEGTNRFAKFNQPNGIARDADGNLYVADRGNNTIRKLTPQGTNWVVSTIAGSSGQAGDSDGTGDVARFTSLYGLAFNNSGDLFVSEYPKIRRLQFTQGGVVVTTIAGNYLGGNIDGVGSAAKFSRAIGLSFDPAGNLYVVDSNNQTIRKGTLIFAPIITVQPINRTVGPDGSATFTVSVTNLPPFGYLWFKGSEMIIDATNSVFSISNAQTSDAGDFSVVVTNAYGSVTSAVATLTVQLAPLITSLTDIRGISTGYPIDFQVSAIGVPPFSYQWFKDGTPLIGATDSPFVMPNARVDDSGVYSVTVSNAYGTASRTNVFGTWVVPSDTYFFDTIAGLAGNPGASDGTNGAAQFDNPTSIAVDAAGRLFLTDFFNHTIRMITPEGTNWIVKTIAGLAGASGTANGTNGDARFYHPDGITTDPSGHLYVAENSNHTIRKITPDGTNWVVTTVAGSPGAIGNANGTNGGARFQRPTRLAIDAGGDLFVADTGNSLIRRISKDGTNWVVTTLPGFFSSANGVAVDAAGNVYVAEWGNHTITRLSPAGTNWVKTTIAGGSGQLGSADGTTWARLQRPGNLTIDPSGNPYVADSSNRTIRKIVPFGTNWLVTTVGGMPQTLGATDGLSSVARFNTFYGIAVDAHGTLFISDSGNDTIRRGRLDRGLQITLHDANAVLSWPGWRSNAVLEANNDLSATNGWQNVLSPVEILGSDNTVTVPVQNAAQFFRLK